MSDNNSQSSRKARKRQRANAKKASSVSSGSPVPSGGGFGTPSSVSSGSPGGHINSGGGGGGDVTSNQLAQTYTNKTNQLLKGGSGNATVDQGKTTRAGLRNLLSSSKGNAAGLQNAVDENQQIIDRGGLTTGQRNNISNLTGVRKDYQDMYDRALAPSLTENTMMDTALGNFIGENDPYLNDIINATNANLQTGINVASNSAGRFGSGRHVQTIAEQLGQNELFYRDQSYDQSIDRRNAALAAIEGTRQTGVGNQSNALAGQSGVLGQQFGMRQAGQENMGNALNRTDALFNSALQPAQTQIAVGGIRDQNNFNNSAYGQNLAHLQNIQGLTSGSREVEEAPNGFMQALGIGGNLLSAFL